MEKVYIIHENDTWTQPLLDELDSLWVPYESWHLHEGTVPLDETPPEGIFYNRMSASSHTRGHRFAPELASAVLNWLERHDRTVLNGSNALYLEVSKAAQYEALKKHHIPVPKTTAAVGREALLQAAEKMPLPFITKHNRAGKGLGVQRFDRVSELEQALDAGSVDPSVDGIMLLQEYIQAPEPIITRCEFMDGRFLYAVEVDTSDGFELCPADACRVEENPAPRPKFRVRESFDSPLIPQYEAFLREQRIAFAGIEQITAADGTVYTYDVNTNTNYNADAEEAAGISGMKSLAEALASHLDRVKGEAIEKHTT